MEYDNRQEVDRPPSYDHKSETKRKQPSRIKWFSFGCLTSIILTIVFLILSIIMVVFFTQEKAAPISPHSFLHIVASGTIEEHKVVDDKYFKRTKTGSCSELVKKIEQAAEDPDIDGILLEPKYLVAGYAVLNELIEALELFKAKGKTVFAYLEMSTNQDYYLSTVADKIFLNPTRSSGILLSGTGISSLYFKDMLEKLGIEMTVLHEGKFKGAGEQYSRKTMSPELANSYNDLLDIRYEQLLTDIANRRNISFHELKKIYEQREELFINGGYAVRTNIVDELKSRADLIDEINDGDSRLIKISNYKLKDATSSKSDAIAVVYLQGEITKKTDDSFDFSSYINSEDVKKTLNDIEKMSKVKGVVLRINSRGGSALESDIIYEAISKLRLSKPVVVSMGNMAASGGYYISAPADYIFADPYTMTGSIGVVSMIPNLYQTGKKIGINSQTLYRGKYTNFMNVWETPKKNDIDAMQRSMSHIYQEFLTRVSDGREMPVSEVQKVAQGRIWAGKRAVENGLIDEIGTLSSAIKKVAELKDIAEYEVLIYPKTKDIFDIIKETGFSLSVVRSLMVTNIFENREVSRMLRLYDNVKDNPIQYLSPITIDE